MQDSIYHMTLKSHFICKVLKLKNKHTTLKQYIKSDTDVKIPCSKELHVQSHIKSHVAKSNVGFKSILQPRNLHPRFKHKIVQFAYKLSFLISAEPQNM